MVDHKNIILAYSCMSSFRMTFHCSSSTFEASILKASSSAVVDGGMSFSQNVLEKYSFLAMGSGLIWRNISYAVREGVGHLPPTGLIAHNYYANRN